MEESNRIDKMDQIPKEDDSQGKTGKVISEQNAVEGMRKEVVVESYSLVADMGQILKDMNFPAGKNEIIDFVKRNSTNNQNQDKILSALNKLEEKSYKSVSEVTMSAGVVH
jgi:predicted double-glycine peptidase